ncbi:MAG: Rpn family recombination-promoting nuclease/putative transposase [Vicinamibacteria bacterium]
MGQDQLFKTILEGLLQDFLELFFPEAAARLDFETLRFVDKEVFANVPEGKVREADVVARLETRDGQPELVLVHVEVQAEPKSDFPRRMFEYYALLRLHYGLAVFPIALYLSRGPRPRLAEYREVLFEQELLRFRYHSVALARLPAEEYVGTSPLGAALSALMSREGNRDRAMLRISMLERVVGSELDEALKYLLVNVIETYFELSGEEAERYRRLVGRKENRAVQEMKLTWADKLIEKGREEGREAGREEGREAGVVEGMRRTLVRQLAAKFGGLSDDLKERARSMSEDELESVLDRVLTAATLDELGLGD